MCKLGPQLRQKTKGDTGTQNILRSASGITCLIHGWWGAWTIHPILDWA